MDRNSIVESLAQASSHNIAHKWEYKPTGNLLINDKNVDITLGDIYYENQIFIITNAIKVNEYVFVTEQMFPFARAMIAPQNGKNDWFISAFKDSSHFTFEKVNEPDKILLSKKLIHFVISKILPIIKPEIFEDQHIEFSYKLESL